MKAEVQGAVAPRLLVGARGYAHRAWQGTFYPADLPPEWRFLFYSHRYPAILLPARSWRSDGDTLVRLQDEAPPEFRVVLEVSEGELARLESAPLWPQPFVTACLVRLADLRPQHEAALVALADVLPVVVDLKGRAAPSQARLRELGLGLCGRPAQGRPPAGPYALSLVTRADRALLGRGLRALLDVPAPRGRALFCTDPATAIKGAEEAQLIAELLPAAP